MTSSTKKKIYISLVILFFVVIGGITVYIAVTNKQSEDVTPQPSAAATCCGCYYVDSSQLQDYGWQCPADSDESDNGPLDYRGDGRDCQEVCEDFPFLGENTSINPETGNYNPPNANGLYYAFGTIQNGQCNANCNQERDNTIGGRDFSHARCSIPVQECNPACTTFNIENADGSDWNQPIIMGTPLKVDVTIDPAVYFRTTAAGHGEHEYDMEDVIEVKDITFVFNEGTANQFQHKYTEGTVDWNQHITVEGTGVQTKYLATTTISEYSGDTFSVRAYASDGIDTITSATCAAEYEVIPPEIPLCSSLRATPDTTQLTSVQNQVSLSLTTEITALPENDTTEYFWTLDRGCDNDLTDSPSGEGTVRSSTKTHTVTLNDIDSSQQWCVDAGIEVNGEVIDEVSEGVCSTSFNINKESPNCGDGVCDENERCEFRDSSEITCPGEESLESGTCRPKYCTYCGDGILDEGEICEPANNPNCKPDCTLPQIDLPDTALINSRAGITIISGILLLTLSFTVYKTGIGSEFVVKTIHDFFYRFPLSIPTLRQEYEKRILEKINNNTKRRKISRKFRKRENTKKISKEN